MTETTIEITLETLNERVTALELEHAKKSPNIREKFLELLAGLLGVKK